MNDSNATAIWNRACGLTADETQTLQPGDLALREVIYLHSLTMNGGVFHPFDVLTEEEFSSAIASYRYYGLNETADLFVRAKALKDGGARLGDYERTLDAEYARIATDQVLSELFERDLVQHPERYAPT